MSLFSSRALVSKLNGSSYIPRILCRPPPLPTPSLLLCRQFKVLPVSCGNNYIWIFNFLASWEHFALRNLTLNDGRELSLFAVSFSINLPPSNQHPYFLLCIWGTILGKANSNVFYGKWISLCYIRMLASLIASSMLASRTLSNWLLLNCPNS